jgi:hypothetical protein
MHFLNKNNSKYLYLKIITGGTEYGIGVFCEEATSTYF